MKSTSDKTSDKFFIELTRSDIKFIVDYLSFGLEYAHSKEMHWVEKGINNYIKRFKSLFYPYNIQKERIKNERI